jgi:hypothetical protein
MALDLNAIRKKLAGMTGNRAKRLKIVDDKTFKLRIIAFPDNDGQPFKERLVYSIGREWNLLAPSQFGKPDPIKELIDQLRNREGKSEEQAREDWSLAKQLFAKVKHHAVVIDRDNEDQGPVIWSFTQSVAKRLYGLMLDEDYGDITDPLSGFDLKVRRIKGDNGFREYTIDARPNKRPLSVDDNKASQWMDNLPSIDGLYVEKSYAELESVLSKFLNGDDTDSASFDTSIGTERRGRSTDSSSEPSKATSSTETYKDLDAAFDALAD